MGVFSALEIALCNEAYKMIAISTMTVIKSALSTVTYLVAIAFGLEKFNINLLFICLFILASISLTVPSMEVYNIVGVYIVCIAVVLGAIRWCLVQKSFSLLHNRLTTSQLLLLTQPFASLTLLTPSLIRDLPRLSNDNDFFDDSTKQLSVAIIMVSCVLLAYLLMMAEYRIIYLTSGTSLTIAGLGKEVFTIIMSMIVFHEKLSINVAGGVGLSIVGIGLYIWERQRILAKEALEVPRGREELELEGEDTKVFDETLNNNLIDEPDNFDNSGVHLVNFKNNNHELLATHGEKKVKKKKGFTLLESRGDKYNSMHDIHSLGSLANIDMAADNPMLLFNDSLFLSNNKRVGRARSPLGSHRNDDQKEKTNLTIEHTSNLNEINEKSHTTSSSSALENVEVSKTITTDSLGLDGEEHEGKNARGFI